MAKSLHTPEYQYLRKLLVSARENSELTQAGVSASLGLPQSFVSKYENGERRLDVIEFIHVCLAIGIDPASIIVEIQRKIKK